MSNHEISRDTRYTIYSFLLKEFLNTDDKTLNLITKHYYLHYGISSGDYLKRAYNSWKQGQKGISSLTFGRVVRIMPLYLSEEKRFFILRTEVERFVANLKSKKHSEIKLLDINSAYCEIQNKILDFNEKDLEWFVGTNIFTNELIDQYLKICKYVLNKRIIQEYNATIKDLLIFKNKISALYKFIDLFEYEITFLNKTVKINKNELTKIVIIKLRNFDFSLDSSFNKFGQQYFLNELMSISLIEKENNVNTEFMSTDLELYFNQFLELKNSSKDQILMKSTFKGTGGNLKLNILFIPVQMSQTLLLISMIKFFTLFIIIFLLISALYLNPILWWFVPVGIAYLILLAYNQLENIKLATQQIRKYGK